MRALRFRDYGQLGIIASIANRSLSKDEIAHSSTYLWRPDFRDVRVYVRFDRKRISYATEVSEPKAVECESMMCIVAVRLGLSESPAPLRSYLMVIILRRG